MKFFLGCYLLFTKINCFMKKNSEENQEGRKIIIDTDITDF